MPCRFTRRELEEIRRSYPFRHQTYGPRDEQEVRLLHAARAGWPG